MADLKTSLPTYSSGVLDSASLVVATDQLVPALFNGAMQGVAQLENELGVGVKGTAANLATRLSFILAANGGLRSVSAPPSPPPAGVVDLVWRQDLKQLFVFDPITASYISTSLADNSVTTSKIQDLAVTTAKLADLAVTTAKIANNAVTTAQILDGTILDADISASGITTRTKLPNLIAYEDEQNIFTVNQRINAGLGVNVPPPAIGTIAVSGTLIFNSSTAFTGTITHANTAEQIWAMPNKSGVVLVGGPNLVTTNTAPLTLSSSAQTLVVLNIPGVLAGTVVLVSANLITGPSASATNIYLDVIASGVAGAFLPGVTTQTVVSPLPASLAGTASINCFFVATAAGTLTITIQGRLNPGLNSASVAIGAARVGAYNIN